MSKIKFNALGNANLAALAMQNIAVNGFAEVSQEYGNTGINSGYPADFYGMSYQGGMVIAGQRVQNAFPTMPGIRHAVAYRVSTAKATLAAGDWAGLYCGIEGNRLARLAYGSAQASPVSIGLMIRPYQTGEISFTLRAYGTTGRTYSIKRNLVANTDQLVTFVVPGDIFAAGHYTDTRAGAELWITLAAGTTMQASAEGAWTSGNQIAAPGQPNLAATVNNGFVVSGLVIAPGAVLPGSQEWPFLMRQYEDEDRLCQRYWKYHGTISSWYFSTAVNGVVAEAKVVHPVQMRSTGAGSPSLTYQTDQGVAGQIAYVGTGGGAIFRGAAHGATCNADWVSISGFAPGTAFNAVIAFNVKCNARL